MPQPPQGFSRRLLLGAGAGGAVLSSFSTTANAAPRPAADPRGLEPELFGPASRTGAVMGAAFVDDTAFVLTRYGHPTPIFGVFDLETGEMQHTVDVPAGTGGYTLATAGGHVYLGLTEDPHIWDYDVEQQTLSPLAEIGPPNNWTYGLCTGPDGAVYAGTYPRGEVWRVDPTTGKATNLGAPSSSQYARVAADEHYIYGGSQAPSGLVAHPIAGGDPIDLTAALPDPAGGVAAMVADGGLLHVATGSKLLTVDPSDPAAVISRQLPDKDRLIDALTITADGDILALGRPSCTLYRVDRADLTDLGSVTSDDENRGVHQRPSGTIVGVAGSGQIWQRDPSGETTIHDMVEAGLAMPEKAQSMTRDRRGRIWVGGHFSLTRHEPAAGRRTRIHLPGEPKTIVPHHGTRIFAAMYPSTEILDISDDLTVTSLGKIGEGQYRPREAALHSASDQLLVATGPKGGALDGALTFIKLRTGRFSVYPAILPFQSIMSVHVEGDTAYICGDTYGEQNPPRERDTAQIAAVDIHSHEVLWRIEPKDQWGSLEHVTVHDGLLYCVARRPKGGWVALDLETREVVREGTVSGYGEVKAHRGTVYAATNFSDQLSILPGRTGDQETLYEPIPIGWYNDPMLTFDGGRSATWGMWGTDLARLPLS